MKDDLIHLQDALKSSPLCSGVYTPTSQEDFIVFYSGTDHPLRIDLANTSVPQLVQLLSSCATLDESDALGDGFRRSGKLEEFMMKFDPIRSGILHVAAKELLDMEEGEVDAELEGFYVYGKGSSIKIESTNLGILVVVFPTVYEGDHLTVLEEDEKWSFDPAKALAGTPKPSVAYAATTSGLSLDVSAGHLCMLVYRIIKKSDYVGITPNTYETEEKVRTAMSSLLADSEILADGGYLGFGLEHKYPNVVKKNSIEGLMEKLVGCDSLVQRVCSRDLALKVSLHVIYDKDPGCQKPIMMKKPIDLTDWFGASIDASIEDFLKQQGGEEIFDAAEDDLEDMDGTEVWWVVDLTDNVEVETLYSGYGHKPSVSSLSGYVCLMVEIPARAEGGSPMIEDDDESDGGDEKDDKSDDEDA